MARAIPHVALFNSDNAHLHCGNCGEPLHDEFTQDVLLRSIEEVRQNLTMPDNLWAQARGEENYKGEGGATRVRRLDIDPVYVKALEEVREGLSGYPLQGGVQFRNDNENHIMEDIWAQQTGTTIPASASAKNNAIGKWIRENNIKGHTQSYGHGMSQTSKMWGPSEDTPTWGCPTGSKLRGVPGTMCEWCYADSGNQKLDQSQNHLSQNLLGLANPKMYAAALSWQLGQSDHDLIRLNASGDLQSPHHLALLLDVARTHPDKKFWLATLERDMVRKYLNENGHKGHDSIPSNVNVRISEGRNKRSFFDSKGLMELSQHPQISGSSGNASHIRPEDVYSCPAAGKKKEEGTCEFWNCDACWDPSIKVIDYTGHGAKGIHPDLDEEEYSQAQLAQMFSEIKRRDRIMQREATSRSVDSDALSEFFP